MDLCVTFRNPEGLESLSRAVTASVAWISARSTPNYDSHPKAGVLFTFLERIACSGCVKERSGQRETKRFVRAQYLID